MRAPFYHIWIGDIELTRFVETLGYLDSIVEDSVVDFTLRGSSELDTYLDSSLVIGADIEFLFGFMGETFSQRLKAKILTLDVKYAEQVTVTVKAHDYGCVARRNNSADIFDNLRGWQIAKTIAERHSLTYIGETEGGIVWEELPQGNRDDVEMLKYIAARENKSFYFKSNTLYYGKRKFDAASFRTFTYGVDILSFTPKFSQANDKNAASGVKSLDSKVTLPNGETKSEETDTKLAKYEIVFDENADRIGEREVVSPDVKQVKCESEEEAKNIASSHSAKAKAKVLTATLEVEGEPLLSAGQVVTIENVAKRYSGNWRFRSVKHNIKGQGYTCECEMDRNSTNVNTGKAAANVNNSKGEDVCKPEHEVYIYNANGEKVN